jgi:tetratricopeptide (TPR) repeat protein
VADRLRLLWDFDDLDASETRLREQLEREPSPAGRAEVLTQLARLEGLRGRFEAGEELLAEAEAAGRTPPAEARILLERGRLRRSAGDVEGSLPLFESAFAVALEADEAFIAADAAHMAALAAPDREAMAAWTRRGIDIAQGSTDPGDAYWLGPLLNNLGWQHHEAGEHEAALDAFEGALEARERDPTKEDALALARYAVGKTLRALGRPGEAAALVEQAVAWTERRGTPDGWFHEELAEDYAALGREQEAREQARLALPLLLEADRSFHEDARRATRLRLLAGDPS